MATIDQELISENLKKLVEAAEAFASKADVINSDIKDAIRKETDTLGSVVNLVFNSLNEKNEEAIAKLKEELGKSISDLGEETQELSIRLDLLKQEFGGITEKTAGLNTRLDRFAAKTEFLEQHVGSFATRQHVEDSIGKEIAEQNVLLTEKLASKELLEKLEKRLGGEDGEEGLVGKINKLNQTLIHQVNQVEAAVKMQLDIVEHDLASKTTSKEFWRGICVTIAVGLLGAWAGTSWVINNSISPYKDRSEKVQQLEIQNRQIEAQNRQMNENLEEIKKLLESE